MDELRKPDTKALDAYLVERYPVLYCPRDYEPFGYFLYLETIHSYHDDSAEMSKSNAHPNNRERYHRQNYRD